MKMKRYILPALAALLLFAACKDEEVLLNLTATLEQPVPEEGADAKNYLHNDKYIYWDEGDKIMIKGQEYEMTDGAGTRHALFVGEEVTISGSNGETMHAVYPVRSYVNEEVSQIRYPATMPYRSLDTFSFAKDCFPMVAEFKLNTAGRSSVDFHSVSGLARIHIYSTAAEATINSITFTSIAATAPGGTVYQARQMSGVFNVKGIGTNAPYLESTSTAADDKTIIITNINQTVGGTESNFLTFYLPLPAYKSGQEGGDAANNRVGYCLQMTVNATVGGEAKTFTKKLGIQIQRNNMIKQPALNITEWSSTTNPDGDATIGLVGDGTVLRPYQVYGYEDLEKIRAAFKTAKATKTAPVLNGKAVDANTYFTISRSDIVLNGPNSDGKPVWSEGIVGFIGHMKGSSSEATVFGITNNSQAPLFESVAAGGTVEFITLRGSIAYTGTEDFSPLCRENNGKLDNCHNRVNITSTASVAGLCVENHGTITSGSNEGTISTTNAAAYAAGFCLRNYGTLQGFSLSSAKVIAASSAGICYQNFHEIRDCMETVQLTDFGLPGSAVQAGGVVYENNGMVFNCRVDGALSRGSSECHIGAIAYINRGTIDNCVTALNVRSVNTMAGIAAYQTDGGLISNCGTESGSVITASEVAGGLVAHLQGGAVINCYNRSTVEAEVNGAVVGGIVALIGTTDGGTSTTDTIRVENVYSSHGNFFGRSASLSEGNTTTNDVADGLVKVSFKSCYSPNRQVLYNGTSNTGNLPDSLIVFSISDLRSNSGSNTPLADTLNVIASSLDDRVNVGGDYRPEEWKLWSPDQWPVLVHDNASNVTSRHRRSNADRIASARAGGRR